MLTSTPRISVSKSLTKEELFAISQEISKKFTPIISETIPNKSLKIGLTPGELRDISEEVTRKYVPTLKTKKPNVVILPIDPKNLYVFWNLGKREREIASSEQDKPKGIVLRVYSELDEHPDNSVRQPWFDVDLVGAEMRQNVPLPIEQMARSYKAVIGLRGQNNQFTILAISKTIHTPLGNSSMHTYRANKTSVSSNLLPTSSDNKVNQEKKKTFNQKVA